MIVFCESCGKILDAVEIEKYINYCRYCVDEQGKLKSFEEKKTDNIQSIKTILGYGERFSEELALKMMSKYPAWRNIIFQEEKINENSK